MNKARIRIKRGEKTALDTNLVGADKPVAGQPIYDSTNKYIVVGDGANDYDDLEPVRAKELYGKLAGGEEFGVKAVGNQLPLYIGTKVVILDLATGNLSFPGDVDALTVANLTTLDGDLLANGDVTLNESGAYDTVINGPTTINNILTVSGLNIVDEV